MKIQLIATGEILEKPDAWVMHHSRKIGVEFDLVQSEKEVGKSAVLDKNTGEQINSDQPKEKAFMALSEGDRDSVRRGFKELVLRKSGWVLRDCLNKASEEIHISLPDRSAQISAAKDSAVNRALQELRILSKFKEILAKSVEGEDCYVTFEDKEGVLEMVERISFGSSEVDALRAENQRLVKLLGSRAKI